MKGRRRDTWVRRVRTASYEVGPSRSDRVVVVVPGLCVASYLWPACDALASGDLLVCLVEPPGWPRSEAPHHEARTVGDIADWVVQWLEVRELSGVTLVGQSMGAQVAAHVAVRAPARLRMLVLQGPVFDPAYRTFRRALTRWVLDLPRENVNLVLREGPEWARVGVRRVWANLRMSLVDRLEDTLAQVSVPRLVVVGEHDTLSGRPWAEQLSTDPAGFAVMPGLPHSSPHKDPTAFADLLRACARLHDQPR